MEIRGAKTGNPAHAIACVSAEAAEVLRIREQYEERRKAYRRIYDRNAYHKRRTVLDRGTVTTKEIRAIIAAYDGACYVCGEPWEHLDHVIPISANGTHTAENIAPACAACNLSKNKRSLEDWLPQRLKALGLTEAYRDPREPLT